MANLSESDLQQIKAHGLELTEVERQLQRFEAGFPPMHVLAAAKVGDGILRMDDTAIDDCIALYDSAELEVLKFVPASGAASRMFKQLFAFAEEYDGSQSSFDAFVSEHPKIGDFFKAIKNFAFYDELNRRYQELYGQNLEHAMEQKAFGKIARTLLLEEGLSYGSLPKGLLAFHSYEDGSRTPSHEHLVEGLAYATKDGQTNLHFTVSPEHQELFEAHLEKVCKQIFSDKNIKITYSTQHPSTDTIAATPEYEPFRQEDRSLLFRPAGHGALLENLNRLDADLIFVKNIDNVVPDRIKAETIRYKKVLAGILLEKQKETFDLLRRLEQGEDIANEGRKLLEELGNKGFEDSQIPGLLNRPIRVCGMVKNEGEPGGGPFWVDDGSKQQLQIVESAQIDPKDDNQQETFKTGTHFNPVDIVFGRKNYKGENFDLLKYRDEEAGFISEKSSGGRKLLAMELPGLWNGSMSDWNTVLVEVPIITFNPVKEVTDLLKENHQPK